MFHKIPNSISKFSSKKLNFLENSHFVHCKNPCFYFILFSSIESSIRFGFQICSRTGSLIAESGSKPKPRTSTVRKPAIMFIRLVPQNINICMWIIPLFGSFLFPIHSTYIYGYIFRALYRTLFTHTHIHTTKSLFPFRSSCFGKVFYIFV